MHQNLLKAGFGVDGYFNDNIEKYRFFGSLSAYKGAAQGLLMYTCLP
jgi:hypothetical protein